MVAPLAVPPFISSYAWVSISNRLSGFRGRAGGGDLRLLSAGLSAGRRRLARARSRARGDRARAGRGRLGLLPARRAAAASPGAVRRRAAGRAQYADRIRRFRVAALSHLHHRTSTPNTASASMARKPRCSRWCSIGLCLALVAAELRVRGRRALCARRRRRASARARRPRSGALRWPVVCSALGAGGRDARRLPVGMVVYWLLQHAQAATSPVAPSVPALFHATLNSLGFGLMGAGRGFADRRRRSAIWPFASRAAGRRSSSAPLISPRACPASWSRWR